MQCQNTLRLGVNFCLIQKHNDKYDNYILYNNKKNSHTHWLRVMILRSTCTCIGDENDIHVT